MRTPRCAAIVLLLLGPATAARAESWVVTAGDVQTVGFRSKAPLESFEGSTHDVNGSITLDPAFPGSGFTIEVRVGLASIDTGIALRNRHMRENHLHTDRFPLATFRGDSVAGAGDALLEDHAPHDITVVGELEVHGVKRPVSVVLTLRLDPDGVLHISCEFPVSLSEYDIPRPRFLFAKLGEVQQVFADLAATIPAG